MPSIVALDASVCIAAFDGSDAHHAAAVRYLQEHDHRFVSTLAVIAEAMHVLDFRVDVQVEFLEWVRKGAVSLVQPTTGDLQRTGALMLKYADLPMDFSDGLLVALCERMNIRKVATFDRDFDIYRLHGRQRIRNDIRSD